MALDFVATIYNGDNRTGLSRIIAGGQSHRSDGDDGNELMAAGFWYSVESVQLSTSARTDANLILCMGGDYSGPFVQVTLAKGGGVAWWDTWGNIGSAYAVATNRTGEREVRLSAREQLEAQWISFLDQELSGTQASREGRPLITWQAFPRGISFLDETLVYLKVHQSLHISIDWWPDYAASMTYHLLLYVDGAGHVRVWGSRWALWVENGAKEGRIRDRLRPRVMAGLGELQSQVNARLAAFDGIGSVREVYLLPGNQVTIPGTGALTGDTNDDATIVVVL
jgi:hypothetical protein